MSDHRLPTPEYVPTSGTYSTVTSPPDSEARLQATDVYMDDMNCLAQGSPAQQKQVIEMFLQGIKDIFPSLPANIKESISLDKARQGDGDWDV